jgi:hypothetical protein
MGRSKWAVGVSALTALWFGVAPLNAQSSVEGGAAFRPADAQALVEEAAEKERLAEGIIVHREEASGPLDPLARALAKQDLLGRTLEALRAGDAPLATARNLVFTAVAPCRILDTRFSVGGILTVGARQAFKVAGDNPNLSSQGGSPGGCGIPSGATAVAVNFGATQSAGPGNLRAYAWAASATAPTASVLNFGNLAPVGLATVPNGAIVSICDPAAGACLSDMYLEVFGNRTHLVADVTGYFLRASVIDQRTRNFDKVGIPTGGGCTNYSSGGAPWGVTITVPVAGRVTVSGIAVIHVGHDIGQGSVELDVILSDTPTTCFYLPGYDSFVRVNPAEATATYDHTVPVQKTFDVPSGGTYIFYLNGNAVPLQGATTDQGSFNFASLIASFQPN